MWVAGFALFVLGIVFIISGPVSKRANARRSAQTEGVLRSVRDNDENITYVYSYCVDDTAYKLVTSYSAPGVNKAGDTCTIWYNPKKPKDAQAYHSDSNKIYRIFLILGIVLVFVGIVLFFIGL